MNKTRVAALLTAGALMLVVAWVGKSVMATDTVMKGPATAMAPSLPGSDGLSHVPGMTEVLVESRPLWAGSPGTGYTGPYTPAQLGLVGGLREVWVLTGAVQSMGPLGRGLQLPLPKAFVKAHPGEILDVYVQELAFNNPQGPRTLLHNSQYNNQYLLNVHLQTPPYWVEKTVRPAIAGGWAYALPNQDHNGEMEYLYIWGRGNYWNEVAVEGRGITAAQAYAFAERVSK